MNADRAPQLKAAVMRFFLTTVAVAMLLLATVFCSGCQTVFLNPLSNQRDATLDRRLLGRWKSKAEKNSGAYLQFDPASKVETKISASGIEPPEQNPVFTMFTSKIGAHTYMNLNPTDEYRNKGYLIARYAVTGDELTVWIVDSDKIKAAILEGKLKGTAGQALGDTAVTDSMERIAAFIESPEGEKTFEYFGTFEKVRTR